MLGLVYNWAEIGGFLYKKTIAFDVFFSYCNASDRCGVGNCAVSVNKPFKKTLAACGNLLAAWLKWQHSYNDLSLKDTFTFCNMLHVTPVFRV